MNLATTLLNSETTDIIPMDLVAAYARIAAVMGNLYDQFMPLVLPHMVKRAAEKLQDSITDDTDNANNLNGEGDDGGNSVSIPGKGVKKVKIDTTQLEEKAQAHPSDKPQECSTSTLGLCYPRGKSRQ